MLELCSRMQKFYPKEISKILKTQIGYFERLEHY